MSPQQDLRRWWTFGDFVGLVGRLFGLIGRLAPDATVRPERFPALRHFLGNYYHQDWDLDYPDWEAGLAAFLREEPAERVRETVEEIDRLLALGLEDRAVARLAVALGSNCVPSFYFDDRTEYDSESNGMTITEWLRLVCERMREFLKTA